MKLWVGVIRITKLNNSKRDEKRTKRENWTGIGFWVGLCVSPGWRVSVSCCIVLCKVPRAESTIKSGHKWKERKRTMICLCCWWMVEGWWWRMRRSNRRSIEEASRSLSWNRYQSQENRAWLNCTWILSLIWAMIREGRKRKGKWWWSISPIDLVKVSPHPPTTSWTMLAAEMQRRKETFVQWSAFVKYKT